MALTQSRPRTALPAFRAGPRWATTSAMAPCSESPHMASSMSDRRRLRRRGSGAPALLALYIAVVLMSGAAIAAVTPLATLSFSPDIPVTLGVTYVDPAAVGTYNFTSGAIAIMSFPGLPPGAHITGYAALSATEDALTLSVAANLPIDNKGNTGSRNAARCGAIQPHYEILRPAAVYWHGFRRAGGNRYRRIHHRSRNQGFCLLVQHHDYLAGHGRRAR